MFINPKTAIESGWIKFPKNYTQEQIDKTIQPNALDFSLDRVFTADSDKPFVLSETSKQMRPQQELHVDDGEFFTIGANSWVDCMSDYHVTVPEGVAAFLIVRSTLNRNGLFVTSGLYDSGFSNYVGWVLHNRGGDARIAKGTRVGQLVFVKSEISGLLYSGGYNGTGQHWSTKAN